MPNIRRNKIIRTFYEYGKIEHIFYVEDGKIVRIRAFSYEGEESEVTEENLHKWRYDPDIDLCYLLKADD